MRRLGMEGSFAVAEAVRLADVDVVAAYPITPQTHIVERISELVANGELEAEFICVESEHSAMSACLGASAAGARAFTATAGQGLELMHEVLYVAPAMRLPVVMTVANRALSSPLNVWGDHSDAMAVRDCGWIQVFAETGQEVFDLTYCAFRIGEDPRVLLPVMVHLDGFHLSHVIEPVEIPDPEEVEGFLPPYRHPYPLDPRRPVTLGAYGPPYIYMEAKRAQEEALRASKRVVLEVWERWREITGRAYRPVEVYRGEDAEVLLMVMGSFAQTAAVAVDELREEGLRVGLVRLRLWRPFPFEELRQALRGVPTVVVLDRCLSFGGPGGPVWSEVASALYGEAERPRLVSFIGGLGGREIEVEEFKRMVREGMELAREGARGYRMIGLRE